MRSKTTTMTTTTIEIKYADETAILTCDLAQASAPILVNGDSTGYITASARHDTARAVLLACKDVWPETRWPSEPTDGDEAWDEVAYKTVSEDEDDDREARTWRGKTVRLVDGSARPHYETAVDSWEDLGWCEDWRGERRSGQVHHPVCGVEILDTKTDAAILAEIVEGSEREVCDAEREAYESAIKYARTALADMRAIDAELTLACDAYELGDIDDVISHLDHARRAEDEYGDAPTVDALADLLFDSED